MAKNDDSISKIKPPEAYDDEQPYIFISYKRDDKDIIYPLIK